MQTRIVSSPVASHLLLRGMTPRYLTHARTFDNQTLFSSSALTRPCIALCCSRYRSDSVTPKAVRFL